MKLAIPHLYLSHPERCPTCTPTCPIIGKCKDWVLRNRDQENLSLAVAINLASKIVTHQAGQLRHAPLLERIIKAFMRPISNQPREISLREYVKRRNGVPLGANGSLQNMMKRSFGARSFAGFWRYWNPIFGYYLGTYIYRPTNRIAPRWLALIVTFLVCGGLHDLVTLLARGSTQFLFTLWFFFFAAGVLIAELTGLNFTRYGFWVRAAFQSAYVSLCLALAVSAQRFL